jgi:hypothetical protein
MAHAFSAADLASSGAAVARDLEKNGDFLPADTPIRRLGGRRPPDSVLRAIPRFSRRRPGPF